MMLMLMMMNSVISMMMKNLKDSTKMKTMRILMSGIVVYFLNFFTGKSKNQKMANQLFNAHRSTLESQFSLVGDDGNKNIEDVQEPLIKESENIFRFWCSG